MLRQLEHSHARIATELGVSARAVVHDWRLGRRVPSDVFRLRMRDLYGIAPEYWDLTVNGTPIPRRLGRGYKQNRISARYEAPTDFDAPNAPIGPTRAEVDDQIRRIRAAAAAADVTPGAAARLGSELRNLLRLRAQLEANEPVTLDRLARSDAFRGLCAEVIATVRDCPHCLDKLVDVLGAGLEGEPH